MAKKATPRKSTSKKSSKPGGIIAWLKKRQMLVFALLFATVGSITYLITQAQSNTTTGTCTPHPAKITIDNDIDQNTFSNQPGINVQSGGSSTLYYEAIDGGLNCGSATYTITLNAPKEFTFSPNTASVTLTESSPTYYQKLTSRLSAAPGTPAGFYSGSVTIVNNANPSLTYTAGLPIQVYTSVGNLPVIRINSPANGSTVSSPASILATATDDNGPLYKMEAWVDGTLVATQDCSIATSSDLNICKVTSSWKGTAGSHQVEYRAYDPFPNPDGSHSYSSASTSFVIDGSAKGKRR